MRTCFSENQIIRNCTVLMSCRRRHRFPSGVTRPAAREIRLNNPSSALTFHVWRFELKSRCWAIYLQRRKTGRSIMLRCRCVQTRGRCTYHEYLVRNHFCIVRSFTYRYFILKLKHSWATQYYKVQNICFGSSGLSLMPEVIESLLKQVWVKRGLVSRIFKL